MRFVFGSRPGAVIVVARSSCGCSVATCTDLIGPISSSVRSLRVVVHGSFTRKSALTVNTS